MIKVQMNEKNYKTRIQKQFVKYSLFWIAWFNDISWKKYYIVMHERYVFKIALIINNYITFIESKL